MRDCFDVFTRGKWKPTRIEMKWRRNGTCGYQSRRLNGARCVSVTRARERTSAPKGGGQPHAGRNQLKNRWGPDIKTGSWTARECVQKAIKKLLSQAKKELDRQAKSPTAEETLKQLISQNTAFQPLRVSKGQQSKAV